MNWKRFEFNEEAIAWCFKHGMARSASMNHADTKNSRNFFSGKPPYHRHVLGIKGELAYSWWLRHINRYHPVDIKTLGRGDTGTDFPGGVQIKSSDLDHVPNLLIGVTQWQRKHANYYVLAWVRPEHVWLIGWISTEEFEKIHKVREIRGDAVMVVDYRDLHPMDELEAVLIKDEQTKAVAAR